MSVYWYWSESLIINAPINVILPKQPIEFWQVSHNPSQRGFHGCFRMWFCHYICYKYAWLWYGLGWFWQGNEWEVNFKICQNPLGLPGGVLVDHIDSSISIVCMCVLGCVCVVEGEIEGPSMTKTVLIDEFHDKQSISINYLYCSHPFILKCVKMTRSIDIIYTAFYVWIYWQLL